MEEGGVVPEELSEEEILELIADLGRAASAAVHQAGFDGVEIHAANVRPLPKFAISMTDFDSRATSLINSPKTHATSAMTNGVEVLKIEVASLSKSQRRSLMLLARKRLAFDSRLGVPSRV